MKVQRVLYRMLTINIVRNVNAESSSKKDDKKHNTQVHQHNLHKTINLRLKIAEFLLSVILSITFERLYKVLCYNMLKVVNINIFQNCADKELQHNTYSYSSSILHLTFF